MVLGSWILIGLQAPDQTFILSTHSDQRSDLAHCMQQPGEISGKKSDAYCPIVQPPSHTHMHMHQLLLNDPHRPSLNGIKSSRRVKTLDDAD